MEYRGYENTVRAALLLAALTSAAPAARGADWLCTEVASQRSGNVVRSCGVGLGADENAARRAAFENARAEFSDLCSASSDCRGHAVNVQPERTSCEADDEGYKCYRLLVFTIGTRLAAGEEAEEVPLARTASAAERLLPKAPPAGPRRRELNALERDEIAGMVADRLRLREDLPAGAHPKIKIGMTKAEALAKFGRPDVVRENDYNVAVFYRSRSFCDGRACMFRFERESGLIITYQDFRHEFTEALN